MWELVPQTAVQDITKFLGRLQDGGGDGTFYRNLVVGPVARLGEDAPTASRVSQLDLDFSSIDLETLKKKS